MPASLHLNVPEGHPVPAALVERAVELTLKRDGVCEGEFSVTFLADEPIHDLNLRWLDHDWVPDVLSFALHDPGESPIGDIYIGVDQAQRQALENGVARDEELVRLTIHGVLHVLGHEHSEYLEDAADGSFFTLQEAILREATAPKNAQHSGES